MERLCIYHRVLVELARQGTGTVSSDQLAVLAGVGAATVRKDLSFLGSFGTRGAGYEVAFLLEQVDRCLGLDREWAVVIAGLGNLGRALANSEGFTSGGFRVVSMLDVDPGVVGTQINGIAVRHLDDLPSEMERNQLSIGVVTTPSYAAQDVAERLVEVGITAILNFAPVVLQLPAPVQVRRVDLSVELQVMSFNLTRAT